ncbi:MAG: N-acetylmuramoyl-L-alanine amidase [Parabacteroides sp.]
MKRFLFLFVSVLWLCLPSLAAQEKAYPKPGEGVTLFLQRFHCNTPAQRQEFLRINKGKFGKNQALIQGVAYTLPSQAKSQEKEPSTSVAKSRKKNYEPLFGKALASYPVSSQELKGACFYLVSGHGGPDPGAIGRVGKVQLHEDEYAYDIVLRLARNLLMRGAEVHIIIQDEKDGIRDDRYLSNSKRETCMGKPIPLNQVSRLKQRCAEINTLSKKSKAAYKRALFVHVDSRSKGQQTDVFFYYKDKHAAGQQLAKRMKNTFAAKYRKHQPGRGFTGTVSSRSLYVLNNTQPTSLFVELGNIQNSFDQQRLVLSNNRQALANWLCEGFVADFKARK